MRTIKEIHLSRKVDFGSLLTYSPLMRPAQSPIDPFIFLNHHGPQFFEKNNYGLPFGPHPHRGIETVTFIVKGDIVHKDSSGHVSKITSGGIQWMTAGKGLIHAEVSSDEFKQNGGDLEILQLWINLAAKNKMTEPYYLGLQGEDIPKVKIDDKVSVDVISGMWGDVKGKVNSISNISLFQVYFNKDGNLSVNVPVDENIFFYAADGELIVNNESASKGDLVEFNHDSEMLDIKAVKDSLLLFGYAKPLNEPVVAIGPFVMNTIEEIEQANKDYREGKFGSWHG